MNRIYLVFLLYGLLWSAACAGEGAFEGKIDGVSRHANYIKLSVTPKLPEFSGLDLEKNGCKKLTIDVDQFDFFKWNIVAMVFSKNRPESSKHNEFISAARNFVGKAAYFSLVSDPKRLSPCHLYVDGVGYWIKDEVIDVGLYYELREEG